MLDCHCEERTHDAAIHMDCFTSFAMTKWTLHLNLDSDSGGEVEMLKRVNSFVRRRDDVDESLVGQDFEVFAGVFVGMGTDGDDD